MYIGCHMSIGKGFANTVTAAQEIGANTMQFFTRNPRGSRAKKITEKEAFEYRKNVEKYEFGPVVSHAPYILNFASYKDDMWELAQRVLLEDLERMELLGVPYITLHPGNHVGKGVEFGIERIAKGLLNVLKRTSSQTMILLETMAGSGTEIGSTFEELKEIINLTEEDERIGVCFDTCHTFAAGYPVDTDLDGVLKEFDKVIGLSRLKAVHVNDSKNEKASKKDRHANIGTGELGLEFFKTLVKHPFLQKLPLVLETPGDLETYKKEIEILKNFHKE